MRKRDNNTIVVQEEKIDGRSRWKDEYTLKIYELAKDGYNQKDIAALIGVTYVTFMAWRKKNPDVKRAIKKGRAWREKHKTNNWNEFIYGKLPSEMRIVWDKLNELEKDKIGGLAKIEMLLENQGKQVRQYLLLHALIGQCRFNLHKACQKVNITPAVFNKWKETDPDFVSMINMIPEIKKDLLEEQFFKLVEDGDSAAILFGLKTLAKDRGYGEKKNDGGGGTINNFTVVNVEQLNLPLETRRQILEGMRKQVDSTEVLSLPQEIGTAKK